MTDTESMHQPRAVENGTRDSQAPTHYTPDSGDGDLPFPAHFNTVLADEELPVEYLSM